MLLALDSFIVAGVLSGRCAPNMATRSTFGSTIIPSTSSSIIVRLVLRIDEPLEAEGGDGAAEAAREEIPKLAGEFALSTILG